MSTLFLRAYNDKERFVNFMRTELINSCNYDNDSQQ